MIETIIKKEPIMRQTLTVPFHGRLHLPLLCNERGLTGVAVEIGTYLGLYAAEFLARWKGERLVTVDDYRGDTEIRGDRDTQRKEAVERLAFFGARAQMLMSGSVEAAAGFPEESVDFIHIDGGHDYESCRKDIEAWWPKMRRGSIFTGHDYCGFFHGVIDSVHEHAARLKLPVYVIREHSGHNTWMIEVP